MKPIRLSQPQTKSGHPEILKEPESISIHISGSNGKIGKDLGTLALTRGFEIEQDPEKADYVTICTPSHVSLPHIKNSKFKDKTVIDLSGASKLLDTSQYGLMETPDKPWDKNFDANSKLFSNPGCIASATIIGIGRAGLTRYNPPTNISVFSVGGNSHAPSEKQDTISLARRLNSHPHTWEIEQAFSDRLHVESFMPAICDVPNGLLVSVHGKTIYHDKIDKGDDDIETSSVGGTDSIRHRLEIPNINPSQHEEVDFSLAVTIDNLRFITSNALNLISYINNSRSKN